MGFVPPSIPIKTIGIRNRSRSFDICPAEYLLDSNFDPGQNVSVNVKA